MKAKLPSTNTTEARNLGNTKEVIRTDNVVALHNGQLITPILIRWYMGRSSNASTVYCSIWVHGKGRSFSGHGKASGCGYHKESTALDNAIRSAGIELSTSINGVGDSAIGEAERAIVVALGYRGKIVIV